MFRVTGGSARGRRLKVPAGLSVRPTSAKVREALFNILAGRAAESAVLDLYCGAGALGIEALSRGARAATFVDRSRQALTCLRANLATLGFGERCRCLQRPLPKRLERLPERPFGLIFSDPPYAEDWRELIPLLGQALRDHGAVSDETLWCHELSARSTRGSDVEAPLGWALVDTRRYGDTALWLFEPR